MRYLLPWEHFVIHQSKHLSKTIVEAFFQAYSTHLMCTVRLFCYSSWLFHSHPFLRDIKNWCATVREKRFRLYNNILFLFFFSIAKLPFIFLGKKSYNRAKWIFIHLIYWNSECSIRTVFARFCTFCTFCGKTHKSTSALNFVRILYENSTLIMCW